MRLTEHTDYALRVLMYLGGTGDRLATIEEVADMHGISRNHLTKVVHRLGRAGFVKTVRGRAGGMRLARDPSSIMVGEVVRVTEPDFRIVECLDDENNECPIASTCALKCVLGKATNSFLRELDRIPLSSVMQQPKLLT
ncbi:Rrf2 family transcriptional regulator [Massilia arenosa]|uniref:Rrf2 family transcriptional regulator n=1 Tax=Zemynaea arenosa TaxID=2561931 RepID=A0A4Y9SJR3_9BURK|nr:Rrf2 family transcriptional regulator [Massilia arenosa]TFW22591.1 Rrf2 family transcriptional regulator [Massilia arenosa]